MGRNLRRGSPATGLTRWGGWCRGQDSNLRRFLFVGEAVSATHTTPAKLARGAGIKPAASTFGRSRSIPLSYPRHLLEPPAGFQPACSSLGPKRSMHLSQGGTLEAPARFELAIRSLEESRSHPTELR